MYGITINIDPVIFGLGGFELSWHGLMTFLGVVIAIPVFKEPNIVPRLKGLEARGRDEPGRP